MERVTIDDLAARLGISRASVSYALNGRPGVGEQTRSRVLQLAMELGWQPSVSARSLSRSRADAVGIVLSRQPKELGSEPYYMGLLSGIESALSERGISLMIRFVPRDGDSEAAVYRRWTAERRVDAVILTDLRQADPRPALLTELSLPYLVHGGLRRPRPESSHQPPVDDHGRSVDGQDCGDDHDRGGDDHDHPLEHGGCATPTDGWNFNQAADAQLVIDHLAELGHTRIAHVTGPSELVHETERNISVLAGAQRLAMTVVTAECDYSLDGGRNRTAALLRSTRPPTAIIYSNDLMAVGGSAALREADRHDIAVLSWDDSLLCQTAHPQITALHRDPYHAGRRTAAELMALVEGRPAPAAHDHPRPSRLVIRASSRPSDRSS